MPQFDIFLYFTFSTLFLTFFSLFYLFFNLLILPFLYEIIYFRFLKKEKNKFIIYVYEVLKSYYETYINGFFYLINLVNNVETKSIFFAYYKNHLIINMISVLTILINFKKRK